jgi:hypothetical protein
MPNANPAVVNFNGGEVGPLMSGRTDFEKYASSTHRMRRFIPTAQGPAKRCPGTKYVLQARYPDKRVWLQKFEFSFDQAYVIEFGDEYCRFYTDRGVVLEDPIDISNITNANPGVLTYVGADPSNGDWMYITAVAGMTEVNGRYVKVTNVNVGAKTFELYDIDGGVVDTTNYDTYAGNGDAARVYTIASPYAVEDLFTAEGTSALSIAQSGDILYIGCEGYEPRTLTRSGNTSWAFAAYAPNDGPFQAQPSTTMDFTLSAQIGSVSVGSSAPLFDNDSVGMLLRLEPINITTTQWEPAKSITATNVRKSSGKYYQAANTATTGAIRPIHEEGQEYDGNTGVLWQFLHPGYVVLKITAVTSTQLVTATVIGPGEYAPAELLSGATCNYRVGAWGDGMGGAFPYKVAFWRDRLWWGGGQNVYASVAGDYASHAPDTMNEILADNALNLTLAVGNVDKVRWMRPGNALIVGTAGAEIAIRENVTTAPLGPENVKFDLQSAEGSMELEPVLVEDAVLFARVGGRRIMELRFDIQADAWVPRDMNVLYPEVTRSGIIDMEYQKEPDDIIWCVLGDGRLIGLTYDREQNIYGWHQHPIAGTDAKVEAVQIISGPAGDVDDVWVVVSRKIEGDFAYELALESGGELLTEGEDPLVIEDDPPSQTQRFIEYFAQSIEEGEDIQGATYLDASLEFNPIIAADLFLAAGYDVVGSTNVEFTVTSPIEMVSEAEEFIETEDEFLIVLNDPTFVASDVNREIVYRFYDTTQELWRTARARITSFIDQETVLTTIIAPFPDDDVPFNEWRMTATSLRGMYHLEGETVAGLVDGQEVFDLLVTDGTVTLPFAASRAVIGYPYTSTLATQRIEAGASIGTAQAKIKRVHKLGLRLYASLGGKVGPSATNLDYIQYRTPNDYMNEVPPLLTGDTDVFAFPGGYETDGRIWVVADQPLPLTVIALYPELETAG